MRKIFVTKIKYQEEHIQGKWRVTVPQVRTENYGDCSVTTPNGRGRAPPSPPGPPTPSRTRVRCLRCVRAVELRAH